MWNHIFSIDVTEEVPQWTVSKCIYGLSRQF